jgi:hypothetical protein
MASSTFGECIVENLLTQEFVISLLARSAPDWL